MKTPFVSVYPSLAIIIFASHVFVNGDVFAVESAPPVSASLSLIERVIPGRSAEFLLEIIPAEQGRDVFEIESRDGKIVLRGNNGVSLASAFNWYLKYTARCDYSECGTQLALPSILPPVKEKVRHLAAVPHRFMFNYCTYGYTMPWWNWERWERELDWMAMNGINMPFIITGQEAVWINTFTRYGYTEQEVRRWLGSPAHFPWLFMQNMHSFGGELPREWTARRVELAQKIIARARSLGMKTVMQGYYGMVLPDFAKKNPGTKILAQGRWAGGLPRPDMLEPTDPMFAKIAATFMAEQEKLFGRAGYYTADPFHEGGNSKGVDMADCGKRTLAAMQAQDPDAVWIKMCWQTDNATLLSQIPNDRVIALDLWAENAPFWPNGAFKGKPWMWCLLHNFGGNTDLSTQLSHLARVFPETLANPNKGRLVGLALTPEGHCNSPVVYDLMPEFIWRKEAVDIKPWIADYIARRYGGTSAKAGEAWDGILATVGDIRYSSVRETPANSILMARPLRNEKARTYVHTRPSHDKARLAKAWITLGAAAPECGSSDGYRYDLADITRQVLGDLARPVYERVNQAYAAKNTVDFEKHSKLFLKIIADTDSIAATRPEFLLGVWIRDARWWGATPAARDLHEYQARLLITSWNAAPGGDLNDYACRQWAGLLKDYYRGRWELYFTALGDALRSNKDFDKAAFLTKLAVFEKNWVEGHNPYPDKPVGDTVAVAARIAADYEPVLAEFYPIPVTPKPADIIGRWEYHAEGGTHLREFLADGTVRALAPDGAPRNWFDGFRWRIEGDRILVEHLGRKMIITHTLMKDGSLNFESEGFGVGRRVMLPSGAGPNSLLLPQPAKMEAQAGSFRLNSKTVVVAPAPLKDEGQMLAASLRRVTGFPIPVREQAEADAIRLTLDSKFASLAPEGYRLQVATNGIEIAAPMPAGIFYAGRTLLQLASSAASNDFTAIACVTIEDQPRFQWRGVMLDCSRTFQSLEYLKQTIDRMAAYKLNVLHLHLTDDQGWRLEIKRHPELTQKGASFAARYNEPPSHQGFYTQAQMREIVAYAAARHITIVPEIEMPGHSHEVIVCRPDLSCTGKTTGEIFPFFKGPTTTTDVFCAGNEDVFQFLQEVLDEVVGIFPSKFIHIGGDEVPKTAWKSCPKCQARMKAEGLNDERELQSYFIRRMEKHLAGKGRRLIGWDEILEGGLAPNATVMSWRGTSGGLAAAKAGHDVVMSPTSHCYFDYTYGAIDSARAFSFNPVADMTPETARHVLGLQANFWSHIDREPDLVDRQLFPRLLALAERGWSPDNRGDWSAYARRARAQLPRLERMGVHYQTTDLLEPVGAWQPGNLAGNKSVLEFDVTAQVVEAGTYEVKPVFERGDHGLFIHAAELLRGTEVVAGDRHDGFAGARPKRDSYILLLSKPPSGGTHRLRLSISPGGGTNSWGRVLLVGPAQKN